CRDRSLGKRLISLLRRDGGTGRRGGLKRPLGIRRNGGTPCSPGAQGMEPSRSARPATADMSATPPLAVAPSANRAFETELSQTLYFRRLVSTGRAGVAEWQTQRTCGKT